MYQSIKKTVAIVQIQDFDTDIKNTRTCFRIAAETSNLKASDYFIFQSTELSTRVFKGDLVLKNSLDEDDLILNEDDTRDQDGNHFNFQFQIQDWNHLGAAFQANLLKLQIQMHLMDIIHKIQLVNLA